MNPISFLTPILILKFSANHGMSHVGCIITGLVGLYIYKILIYYWFGHYKSINEPQHDKTNKVNVRPAKTQITLGIHPVWSESLLFAWRKRMPSLIWVFAGCTLILWFCHVTAQIKSCIQNCCVKYKQCVFRKKETKPPVWCLESRQNDFVQGQ